MQLLRFHLVEDESCEREIKQELEKKLDRMVMRDLYGKFKNAPTEEERERARKEYLDKRGVPEEEEPRFVGVWGQRHLQYLKEYRRTVYLDLLMSGRLNSYLADIEE